MVINLPTYNQNQQIVQPTKLNKTASVAGSLLGIMGATALIAKQRKVNLSLKSLFNIEYKGYEVLEFASGSIMGGFIGGSLTDKKHVKKKMEEGVSQIVGNYIVPTLSVVAGVKLYNNLTKNSQLKKSKIARFTAGMLSLAGGVLGGNKASSMINKHLFNDKNTRSVNWKDLASQFDNTCFVTSLASRGSNVAKIASKFIPLTHILPGVAIGTKQ